MARGVGGKSGIVVALTPKAENVQRRNKCLSLPDAANIKPYVDNVFSNLANGSSVTLGRTVSVELW